MFLDFLLAQNTITELQYNRVMATLDTEFEGNMTKALLAAGLSEDAVATAKARGDLYGPWCSVEPPPP